MDYRIYPPEDMVDAVVELPLSKSESARALVMAALGASAPGATADCDDTAALRLGLGRRSGTVDIGAAGTAMRFLTAWYAATGGTDVTLDGSERMRRRPIGVLVDALRALGADIEYAGESGYPPLHIRGRRLTGGVLEVDASVSSQFVSALMMVAPVMERGLTLRLTGDAVSVPYIRMTLGMMKARGIDAAMERDTVTVAPGAYGDRTAPPVGRDWSAAAFWYETAALSAGWVTLPGLSKDSVQGDRALAQIYPRMGVVTEFDKDDDGRDAACLSATPDLWSRVDLDMSGTPDLVQAVAVTACAIGLPFTLTGVSTLRVKETDRLEALCRELGKIGCMVETEGDRALTWDGRRMPIASMPVIDTYGDHRMAMAFAPLAIYLPGIVIRDIEVVTKSYPGYWDQLRAAGFTVTDASFTE